MVLANILGIVQILSGIAVISSVVYLAREVSQTTKVVRAQFGHGLIWQDCMKGISYLQNIKRGKSQNFCLKTGLVLI